VQGIALSTSIDYLAGRSGMKRKSGLMMGIEDSPPLGLVMQRSSGWGPGTTTMQL
jgi:hypothetical protein